MTVPGSGSVVVRRQLGARLKRLRLSAGKSVADVVEAGLGSAAKISRLEAGKLSIKIADVRALCWLYGVDQQRIEALVALAPGTRQSGAWWEEYGDALPEGLRLYADLEAAASRIRCFDPDLVHGLLQTEAYARAVVAGAAQLNPDVIESRVRFRMERQRRILAAEHPVEITFVMFEAALVSVVGSAEIMRDQIEHLRRVDRRREVRIHVLPFTAGAYPRRGTFVLLDFADDEDPSVAYLDLPVGARYFDTPEDRAEYERAFQTIADLSVPLKEWNR